MNLKNLKNKRNSLSRILIMLVASIVSIAMLGGLWIFVTIYSNSMRQNAITSTEQAVTQVSNTVNRYNTDMGEMMKLVEDHYHKETKERYKYFNTMLNVRSDIVAITTYDKKGKLIACWSSSHKIKDNLYENLSYETPEYYGSAETFISKPHVETLLVNYYPWVVTRTQRIITTQGDVNWVSMDIRFSQIANYVDGVGIGQHGYCFIMDMDGNIIYHPQQQLIFSGLKEEQTQMLADMPDGTTEGSNVMYTVQTLEDCGWRVVGVSYVDELITNKVNNVIILLAAMLLVVLGTVLLSSYILSMKISRPIQDLMKAMGEFEKNTSEFSYTGVEGSSEILALSQSFEHMVLRIQELMEKVRNEEITLRKTELKALQAQINPHFLYNTLDAIGWLCEEERNKDAVEMVNALAKLFRISISKGHELITIEKELQHAESYLMIEKYRYKNQFDYDFQVDENCLPYLCNKITLQPIIENAIYHGLDLMVDKGHIHITIKQEGEDILFMIEDDGVGMSEEQCEVILSKEPSDRTGIGIKNVNDRIKIYFGERYGLSITSELDVGTKVTIRMPKIEEERYEYK